ncbi:MAG: hypothetical protein J6D28_00105 [Bacilli bacterium]|nr:hypothetical protein [Bacilli bacterium]
MTKYLMEKSLNDIKNLYSAIIKLYVRNRSQKPNKQLYRGTKQSLIESMNSLAVLAVNHKKTIKPILKRGCLLK